MLQTGDIIRIREYIEIPVEHDLWDDQTSRFYRSGERDLEEGLFPGLYKVVTSAYTKHPMATVGNLLVLQSVRISPENIVIPVGDDRFLVRGAKAIDTLERSIRMSVKDWRPEMGASRGYSGFEVGKVVCLDSVFVDVTYVDSRGYADDKTVIRKGFYVVVESKPKMLILSRIELDEHDQITHRSSEYYRVYGKVNIKEIEKAQRCWRSVKDWRPDMGASNPPDDLGPGVGIRIWGTPQDTVPVDYTNVRTRHGERYVEERGSSLWPGQYIVLDYDRENSVLTLGVAKWFHGEPVQHIYINEEFVISGAEEIKRFLENKSVVLYGRVSGKKKWRPNDVKESLVDLGKPEISPAAAAALERAGEDPGAFLERHGSGDWGVATKERVKSNEYVISHGGEGYIVSLFVLSTGESIIVSSYPALGVIVLALSDEYTPPLAEIPGLGMGISLPDRQRLFEPGIVQGTPKAIEALRRADQDPVELLERHLSGDWGDAHHDDVRENMVALKTRDRIIGVYSLSTGETVVVITDPGHETTTVMMPDEF